MTVTYELLEPGQIHLIEPLWEKLNILHRDDSLHFGDRYRAFTFGKRIEGLLSLPPGNLRIETVVSESGQRVGYCLSSVDGDGVGELQSLFLEEEYRGRGIGARLTGESLAWMKSRNCRVMQVVVAGGHESVLPFYERFGFFVRRTVLEHAGDPQDT